MTSRRELLLGVAASLSVAGCLGSDSDTTDEQDVIKTELDADDVGNAEEQGSDTTEQEATNDDSGEESDPLPGFSIQDIELSYYKHLGIITLLRIKNESSDSKFEMKTEAYVPDEMITEAERWEEIPTSLEYPLEVQNDDIWALRNNIGRVTEFVIKGRVPDGEFGVVRSFSGSEFRERVGVEANPEDPEVSVEAEPAEDSSQQAESEQTPETDTDQSAGDDATDPDQTGDANTAAGEQTGGVDTDGESDSVTDTLLD